MKLLDRSHWLVKVNYLASACVFLFTFAATQQASFVQEHVVTIWSLTFVGMVVGVGICAFVVAGTFLNFGYIIASAIYCTTTHDPEWHWFPRTLVSAKVLIARPRWVVEWGL